MDLNNRKKLAELLHEKLCHSNHQDGCDWFYSKDFEESGTKKEYLKKINNIYKDIESLPGIKIIPKIYIDLIIELIIKNLK